MGFSSALQIGLLLFVPLINKPFHYPAHLQKLPFFMNHLFPAVARDRVVLYEKIACSGHTSSQRPQ